MIPGKPKCICSSFSAAILLTRSYLKVRCFFQMGIVPSRPEETTCTRLYPKSTITGPRRGWVGLSEPLPIEELLSVFFIAARASLSFIFSSNGRALYSLGEYHGISTFVSFSGISSFPSPSLPIALSARANSSSKRASSSFLLLMSSAFLSKSSSILSSTAFCCLRICIFVSIAFNFSASSCSNADVSTCTALGSSSVSESRSVFDSLRIGSISSTSFFSTVT
mmetsp:Transcript_4679/g.11211  ORF Transcript_4679/g.11211 Transcript_4679/m.11211 type:complete len:223 (-) Transcript_4679:138-806(-)